MVIVQRLTIIYSNCTDYKLEAVYAENCSKNLVDGVIGQYFEGQETPYSLGFSSPGSVLRPDTN